MTNYSPKVVYNNTRKKKGDIPLKTTVYGDVLFLINLSMDFLSLFISGRILHLECKSRYLLIASVIGGVYGVLALLIKSTLLGVILNTSVYIAMCLIAYPKVSLRVFLKLCVLFYGVSLLCGGAVTAFYSFFDKILHNIPLSSQSTGKAKIPIWLFFALIALCGVLSYVTGRIFAGGKNEKYVDFSITVNGKTSRLHTLCDSGNLLTEPITSTPVIVVCEKWFRENIGFRQEDILKVPYLMSKLRYIPSSTPTGECMLIGILPDRIILTKEKTAVKAVIAIAQSGEFTDFDGIAPICLIP